MTSITPSYPDKFTFYYPIAVRFADLDTHKHVNNIKMLEYVETARTVYYEQAGIWDGHTVENMGMVVVSLKVDYMTPIKFGDAVQVGLTLSQIGSKSLRFLFQLEDPAGSAVFARGEVVMVSYDHTEGHSRLVSTEWREKLARFENNEEFLKA